MKLDRTTFFSYVRPAPFGNRLTQEQVDGMNALLDMWEQDFRGRDSRHLAYCLATSFHETGGRMVPVREGFAKTDAAARKVVAKRKYGKPDATSNGHTLMGPDGEPMPKTGEVYYGRGHVQLTWADNYLRMGQLLHLPLYEQPDLALEPKVSAKILFEGMLRGKSSKGDFTGKSVEDYFNEHADDAVGARRVVNGSDKAHLIAGYHKAFIDSIKAAEKAAQDGTPSDVSVKAAKPDGANLSTDKTIWGGLTAGAGGIAASLIAAINNPWAMAAFIIVAFGVFLVVTGRVEIKRKAGA